MMVCVVNVCQSERMQKCVFECVSERREREKREIKLVTVSKMHTWSGAALPYSPSVSKNLVKPSRVRSPL